MTSLLSHDGFFLLEAPVDLVRPAPIVQSNTAEACKICCLAISYCEEGKSLRFFSKVKGSMKALQFDLQDGVNKTSVENCAML